MNHHAIQDRLNDYVDGLLSDPERREVERHLEGCEACLREVESLRALLADAAALPREIAPARDLWPETAARIAQPKALTADFSRPARWSARRLAAAAVLLVALSSTLTALVLQHRRTASMATTPRKQAATAFAAFEASEGDYIRAVAQLSAAVNNQRDRLDPKTVAVIEKNLRTIDEAIRDSRAALAADPNSVERVFTVARMYETKIDLLRQVADLSAGI
jgi:anti-sigma factor RsiW